MQWFGGLKSGKPGEEGVGHHKLGLMELDLMGCSSAMEIFGPSNCALYARRPSVRSFGR